MLSCPSQISTSSHALKQHKITFAELARYRKNGKSPSVVKNSKEDIASFQIEDALEQKVNFITSRTEKESGRSTNSEAPDIPPLGEHIKIVIKLKY